MPLFAYGDSILSFLPINFLFVFFCFFYCQQSKFLFCQHFLPKGFVKIRHYGIYSSKFRAEQRRQNPKMIIKPKETSQERLKRLTGYDANKCPYCKKGIMHVDEVLPRIRSPCNKPFLSVIPVAF